MWPSWLGSEVFRLRVLHQLRGRNPHRLCKANQRRDRGLSDAALQSRYERPVSPRAERQFLLSQTGLVPVALKYASEDRANISGHRIRHAANVDCV